MREAIGGTWLFQIVITFVVLFTGFMCLTINRSKAYNVKNQLINSIQLYNGIDLAQGYIHGKDDAYKEVIEYMQEISYRTTGNVPDDVIVGGQPHSWVCFNRNGVYVERNPVFCIAEIRADREGYNSGTVSGDLPEMVYYKVAVFYQLNIPMFSNIFNFTLYGDTKTFYR